MCNRDFANFFLHRCQNWDLQNTENRYYRIRAFLTGIDTVISILIWRKKYTQISTAK